MTTNRAIARSTPSTQPGFEEEPDFADEDDLDVLVIEMLFKEHGVLKDENLMNPPDVKYWGEFRNLSNYIVDGEFEGQGYYKGHILENGEIKIAGIGFKKQE